jgi:bacterial/archaeal transporter family-2 protein
VNYIYILLAVSAGVLIPLQTGFNTQLGRAVGSAWTASAIVMIVAMISMVMLATASRAPLPNMGQLQSAPPTAWLGGLLGAVYVLALILLAPKLGAANLVVFVVIGQLIAALTIDHFGLIGFAVQHFTLTKAAGVALLIGGAALIRLS